MTVTRGELQVTWSAADSISVGIAGSQLSDAMAFNANTFMATIQLKAVNSGTPAVGDIINFYATLAAPTAPDGAGAAEYDTTRISLGACDVSVNATAIISANVPLADSVKIYANGSTTTQAITASATITEYMSA